jgi:hypothetical protein
MKAPYRKPNTVKQAIRVRTSKADRRAGDVGVFVNVRPARAAAPRTRTTRTTGAGRNSDGVAGKSPRAQGQTKVGRRPQDRWQRLHAAPAAEGAALDIFEERIAKWLNETNRSGQVIP